jgi:hypothetical protein
MLPTYFILHKFNLHLISIGGWCNQYTFNLPCPETHVLKPNGKLTQWNVTQKDKFGAKNGHSVLYTTSCKHRGWITQEISCFIKG